ncbi:signal peptide peptidase SppA [Novosphingobium sp. PC22D]|uniref:signal peptide peptidase SppA n=1 Tax=Novosphingobium sp. PC22D TaxID=1962403 RepID=UPI000BEF6858|nr:signal peptide peptidase SppA [Novosphingobium sp. PC22D]PEQ14625.1 signal peptide peptidase SppA [Novosphingobium sp. PC22D]
MEFAGKVWKLLVAVKDGLVLVFMLLFFAALYALLSVRPTPGKVIKGALLIALDGVVVEEPSRVDPFSLLTSTQGPTREYRARNVARAIRAAAKDQRIKAVALDLSRFLGGGFVHMREIGEAMDEVRAAGKPVLTFAVAYTDDGVQLAAHASEAWVDPMGGAVIAGPGGNGLYFGKLFEKYGVKARIFRVGTYKSAVEPYFREGPSPAATEAVSAVYDGLFDAYRADVLKARPKIRFDLVTRTPAEWVRGAGGNTAQAAKSAGLVDKIGSKTEFGERLAGIAGASTTETGRGAFAATDYDTYLAATPESTSGAAIGVVTIAGTIVDGEAGPGTAGGERIAGILDKAIDDDLAALVVRVDSPGGSTTASERIRRAIAAYRDRKIPVIVSMGNLAASGGYWVSTPAQRIFADPATVTGSIGVFAVLATFEDLLNDVGVTGGGVKTTPLSGQPDILFGLSPEVSELFQASVENTYAQFLGHVAKARGRTPAQIDAVAQGRPWSGRDAKRLGLVDEFGDLDAALAYAAKAGGLGNKPWHAQYLGEEEDTLSAMLTQFRNAESGAADGTGGDLASLLAWQRQQAALDAVNRFGEVFASFGARAYCIECPQVPSGRGRVSNLPTGLSGLLRDLTERAGRLKAS